MFTAAEFNKSGACLASGDNVIQVLHGVNNNDSLFVIIYTLDERGKRDNPRRRVKANPNLGVPLPVDYLAHQVKDAKNRPTLQDKHNITFLTTDVIH